MPAADATDAAHDSDELAAALDALPPRQRTVLTLRYVDDWSVGQIADGLAISYLAAESLLARARRSFTAALDPGRSGTTYRAGRSKSRRIR